MWDLKNPSKALKNNIKLKARQKKYKLHVKLLKCLTAEHEQSKNRKIKAMLQLMVLVKKKHFSRKKKPTSYSNESGYSLSRFVILKLVFAIHHQHVLFQIALKFLVFGWTSRFVLCYRAHSPLSGQDPFCFGPLPSEPDTHACFFLTSTTPMAPGNVVEERR